ncbi:MAG: DNA repair protein RecO [Pseudomonadota bacterium]
MEWSSTGVLCSAQRHGEAGAIVKVLTPDHGLYAGFVPGGMSKRRRASLEPGNDVAVRWRARLHEHLGTMQIEPVKVRAATVMASPLRLAALACLTSTVASSLTEREALPAIAEALSVTLDLVCDEAIPSEAVGAAVVRFELGLLSRLGFALDLSRCASTGQSDDLAYVSPKTGRAVSKVAGQPYHDRLLGLPAFLLGSQAGEAHAESLKDGFRLTGYFLEKWVMEPRNAELPRARERLIQQLQKHL